MAYFQVVHEVSSAVTRRSIAPASRAGTRTPEREEAELRAGFRAHNLRRVA